jgi:ATP-binding cassette subfamily F protein uup
MDKASDIREEQNLRLSVEHRRLGGKILDLSHLNKAYDELTILKDFSYTFKKGERVGVSGSNGVGKTTFLNLITGSVKPDSGRIETGETVVFGYYTQEGLQFKPGQRVIEAVTEVAEYISIGKGDSVGAATFLEFFLFPRSMHYQQVESLSGGERRRLHLLRILIAAPNFLILDEPTNDLDLMTLRKLESFLDDFKGCLMIVTHDRYFMDRLVDHVFVMEGEGVIRDFPGSYSQYRQWKQEQSAEVEQADKPEKEKTRRQADNRKLSYKEKREYEQLEGEIEALETQKQETESFLNSGASDFEKLQEAAEALSRLQKEIEAKSDRWLELAERME